MHVADEAGDLEEEARGQGTLRGRCTAPSARGPVSTPFLESAVTWGSLLQSLICSLIQRTQLGAVGTDAAADPMSHRVQGSSPSSPLSVQPRGSGLLRASESQRPCLCKGQSGACPKASREVWGRRQAPPTVSQARGPGVPLPCPKVPTH